MLAMSGEGVTPGAEDEPTGSVLSRNVVVDWVAEQSDRVEDELNEVQDQPVIPTTPTEMSEEEIAKREKIAELRGKQELINDASRRLVRQNLTSDEPQLPFDNPV